ICAPRWIYANGNVEYRIIGTCYLLGQDLRNNSAESIDPLFKQTDQLYSHHGYTVYYYAHGQLGMAVHFTNDSELLLGTPGLLNWQGR
ncbi:Integrin alpha-PS4, partial [Armadillidium vulgare]